LLVFGATVHAVVRAISAVRNCSLVAHKQSQSFQGSFSPAGKKQSVRRMHVTHTVAQVVESQSNQRNRIAAESEDGYMALVAGRRSPISWQCEEEESSGRCDLLVQESTSCSPARQTKWVGILGSEMKPGKSTGSRRRFECNVVWYRQFDFRPGCKATAQHKPCANLLRSSLHLTKTRMIVGA